MSDIRGIIFDFGGVFSSQHEALSGFGAAARRFGRGEQELYDLLYSGDEWRSARTGAMTAEQYWRRMMALLDAGHDDVDAFLAELFEGEQIDQHVVRIAEALARRYPLALLSNALDDLGPLLERRYRLRHLFQSLVISAEVGVAKPERRAFELALEGLGLPAEQTLFIDDKQRNVDAALALGIPTIHFTTAAALERELIGRGLLGEAELGASQANNLEV